MTRGRGTASIVASPVLVGAVTTLVVIVSVFLAYNANQGLPFVPTYDVNVQLPSGANLVKSNEVRVGGFRVGLIDKIDPGVGVLNGKRRTIAVVHMKLDKTVLPLPRARHEEPVRPEHAPRRVLQADRPHLGPGRARRAPAGRAVREPGHHVRRARPQHAAGPAADDREEPVDRGHGNRKLPRAASVPRELRRPLAPAAPGRGGVAER